MSNLTRQNKDLQSTTQTLHADLEKQNKQVADLSAKLEQLKQQLDGARDKGLELLGQSKELNIAKANVQLENDELSKKILALNSKVDMLTKQKEALDAEKVDLGGLHVLRGVEGGGGPKVHEGRDAGDDAHQLPLLSAADPD